MNSNVFVVLRDDGIWDAACCDSRCGFGCHGLSDEEFPDEAAARQAATRHRRQIARKEEPAQQQADLRQKLIDAQLATFAHDQSGYRYMDSRRNEEAADRALAQVQPELDRLRARIAALEGGSRD